MCRCGGCRLRRNHRPVGGPDHRDRQVCEGGEGRGGTGKAAEERDGPRRGFRGRQGGAGRVGAVGFGLGAMRSLDNHPSRQDGCLGGLAH